jgi:hypothetical protein
MPRRTKKDTESHQVHEVNGMSGSQGKTSANQTIRSSKQTIYSSVMQTRLFEGTSQRRTGNDWGRREGAGSEQRHDIFGERRMKNGRRNRKWIA